MEGLYSKSTNVKEAEAVVEEIVRRFFDPELKNQSIGVVTFNVKQQTLIENLLAKQFQNNAELDMWANSGDDPLFVKNPENVQREKSYFPGYIDNVYYVRHAEPNYDNHDDLSRELSFKGISRFILKARIKLNSSRKSIEPMKRKVLNALRILVFCQN